MNKNISKITLYDLNSKRLVSPKVFGIESGANGKAFAEVFYNNVSSIFFENFKRELLRLDGQTQKIKEAEMIMDVGRFKLYDLDDYEINTLKQAIGIILFQEFQLKHEKVRQ